MASWRIHQSLIGKEALPLNKYWPIDEDEMLSNDVYTVDNDMMEKIKKAHKIK